MEHSPRFAYDCKRCKFSWCCGYACCCVIKKEVRRPPIYVIECVLHTLSYIYGFTGWTKEKLLNYTVNK